LSTEVENRVSCTDPVNILLGSPTMSPLCIEILRGIFTLTAVGLGSWIALFVYYRQKEYELVKQRYLEGGVDVVATQLEKALGVVSHNYARGLQICKSMRDAKENFDLKELDNGFLELNMSNFQLIAHHRINSLIESDVLWIACQLALAYATHTNSRIVNEMTQAIRLRYNKADVIKQDFAKVADIMRAELNKLQAEGFQYANLIKELNYLSRILECEKLSLKEVATFHKRKEIKDLIERICSEFPEVLSKSIGDAMHKPNTSIEGGQQAAHFRRFSCLK
jgi:hypothetical protein